ncbi:hypothetical protein KFL_001960080 [Klebsormidium nitens]|uniref:EF-hand domain-containing protein n=1 Tax=Klebsormidium nitens TaxID=105231 RepID=A0A1Y1I615_KLENI|nr:hypothetical protein KFL_001960080 [Klebsormidium nitens]|eukprot:GAQ84591.1 hypothetical protein KFL_001960080 [Klebsormidium nitens]
MDEPQSSTSPPISPRKGARIGFSLPRESEQSQKSSSGPPSSRLSRLSASSDAPSVIQTDRSVRRSRTSHNGVHFESGEIPSHESQMNLTALMELRKAFLSADIDGSEELDEEEFVRAFKNIKALGKGMDEQQLTHLFMKIDANSDGSVDWVEFTDYLLLQQLAMSDEAAAGDHTYVKQRVPAHKPTEVDENARGDSGHSFLARGGFALAATMPPLIQKIGYISSFHQYVTASQDGLIKLWSPVTLQPVRTINNGPAWITDMQVSESMRTLVTLGMDRSLSFYSTARPTLDKVGRIQNIETVPMTALWVPGERERLLYGDDKGALYDLQFADEWGTKPGSGAPPVVAEHTLPGIKISAPWKVHKNWVTRLKYISHSASLLSCSLDGYLNMLDYEKREVKWAAKEHQKGVYACDYCRSFNFIVTCGVERNILLWSPYSARPLATLQGHSAPVMDVFVNESEAQILSLGADKVVKVWDFRTNRCIQTLSEPGVNTPSITALFQNPETRALVAGGLALQQWNQKKAKEVLPSQVCTALYNANFRQLVVLEAEGAITVWNVDDGERVFTFSDPLNKASKISAAVFDHTGRRLLVGGQDGSVRVWNFNNGACLKTFVGFGDMEVTCVASVVETKACFVAAAGWNAHVCVWEDSHTDTVTNHKMFVGHADDVSCMAMVAPGVLATGCQDGKVIVWKMDGTIRTTLKREDRATEALERTSVLALCPLPAQAQTLAVAGTDGKVAIWRIADASLVYLLDTGHMGTLGPMVSTLDNKTLFTTDTSGTIKSWDLSSGTFRRQTNLDGTARRSSRRQVTVGPMRIKENYCIQTEDGEMVAIAYADAERMVLTACASGSSRLWTSDGVPIGRFGQEKAWNLRDRGTWISEKPSYSPLNSLAEVDESAPHTWHTLGRGLTMPRLGRLLLERDEEASDEENEEDDSPGVAPAQEEEEILWSVEDQVDQFLEAHKRKVHGTSVSLQKLTSGGLKVKDLAPIESIKHLSPSKTPQQTSHH